MAKKQNCEKYVTHQSLYCILCDRCIIQNQQQEQGCLVLQLKQDLTLRLWMWVHEKLPGSLKESLMVIVNRELQGVTLETNPVMLRPQAWVIVRRRGSLVQWLKGKTLQAILSKGNLFNNLIQTAVISPHMHNAIAGFNNKRNRMTSKDPAS